MGKTRPCPACNGNYFDLNPDNHYCKKHSEWLVTRCKRCGRYAISNTPGICPVCKLVLSVEEQLLKDSGTTKLDW